MKSRSSKSGRARGPRPSVPPLLLLLLLLPWLGLGAASGAGLPGEPESPQDLQLPRLLQRAARVALHFFNFRSGSPCDLRVLGAVQGGRAQVSAGRRARREAPLRGSAVHLALKCARGKCGTNPDECLGACLPACLLGAGFAPLGVRPPDSSIAQRNPGFSWSCRTPRLLSPK